MGGRGARFGIRHLVGHVIIIPIKFEGIPVKRRIIVYLEEDGGCGHKWDAVEIPEDVL